MAVENKSTRSGWKTCSRGHKFRGSRCPVCWPGGVTSSSKRHAKHGAKKRAK